MPAENLSNLSKFLLIEVRGSVQAGVSQTQKVGESFKKVFDWYDRHTSGQVLRRSL